MKKVNWDIHYIINLYGPGGTINAHTHGMYKYNHKEFQVVLNIKPEEIMYLLNAMGEKVQDGETFSHGDMVKGLFLDCDVRLDLFVESGQQVLRLIIPDGNNNFPEDPTCKEPYKYQTERMFEETETSDDGKLQRFYQH